MPRRPSLQYDSYRALQADLNDLQAGYEQGGQWSLGMAADHLARTMSASLEGGKGLPGPVKAVLRWLILPQLLRRGTMPRGVPAPAAVKPRDVPDAQGVAALQSQIDKAQAWCDSTIGHPMFGTMAMESFHRLQLLHAAHHLSFLTPKAFEPSEPA